MRVAVLGGGSWGTAIAIHLAQQGNPVNMWVHNDHRCRQMAERRKNIFYLNGFDFPDSLQCTNDLQQAVDRAELIFSVMPSHHVRTTMELLYRSTPTSAAMVSASKGIEQDTLKRMTEVIQEVADKNHQAPAVAALSGPSFAKELSAGHPTAVVVASIEQDLCRTVQHLLSNRTLRCYRHDDVIGTELGGALKNIIAIASGTIFGLNYGHNTQAALITRGIAEISRLATALDARPETLAGLAGVGDLVLTCTGELSRNRQVGIDLGQGKPLTEILANMKMVAEGVRTTDSGYRLAKKHGIDAPIIEKMYEVLYLGLEPKEAVYQLMKRAIKEEFEE